MAEVVDGIIVEATFFKSESCTRASLKWWYFVNVLDSFSGVMPTNTISLRKTRANFHLTLERMTYIVRWKALEVFAYLEKISLN